YGPALAEFDGLRTVYHARGQNRLVMSTSRDGGATWSAPITAGTPLWNNTLNYAPAVAVHDGGMYVAYCETSGSHDRVHVDRFDGANWYVAKIYDLAGGA